MTNFDLTIGYKFPEKLFGEVCSCCQDVFTVLMTVAFVFIYFCSIVVTHVPDTFPKIPSPLILGNGGQS